MNQWKQWLEKERRPRVLLAPMAGFTDAPMRMIAAAGGAEHAATEMVNAMSAAAGQAGSLRLLELLPGECPVAAHLYGADPEAFSRAADLITERGRHSAIDINCGCPVPKIAKCGAGAELMKNPKLIGKIVAAVAAHTNLPVTVKTRLGPREGEDTAAEVMRIIADAGASGMALHGRYKTQFHAGEVHFGKMAEVVNLGLLPVVGNGGINSPATALEMLEKTGVAGVMVGWAGVGNPWLFRRIRRAVEAGIVEETEEWRVPLDEARATLERHLNLSLEFRKRLAEEYPDSKHKLSPEEETVLGFRCQLFRYLNGMRRVSRLRGRLSSITSISEIMPAVDEVIDTEREFRARKH